MKRSDTPLRSWTAKTSIGCSVTVNRLILDAHKELNASRIDRGLAPLTKNDFIDRLIVESLARNEWRRWL